MLHACVKKICGAVYKLARAIKRALKLSCTRVGARGRDRAPPAESPGYNDRILQVQRNAGLVSRGNVGARRMEGESRWPTIRDEPLPKKKKKN